MKRFILFAMAAICCMSMLATTKTYVKLTGSPTNYTGEYLIGYDMGGGYVAVFKHDTNVVESRRNVEIVQMQNDSCIVADDALAFDLLGSDNTYSFRFKSSGMYFRIVYYGGLLPRFQSSLATNYICQFGTGYTILGHEAGAYWDFGWSSDEQLFKTFSQSSSPTGLRSHPLNLYKYESGMDARVHDTIYVPVHDTTIVIVHDTLHTLIHDTTVLTVYDTIRLTIRDTVELHDTTVVSTHDTIYLQADGSGFDYSLEELGVTYFFGQIINMNGIEIRLYTSDGRFIETSFGNISMADKPRGIYIVTDTRKGILKFVY